MVPHRERERERERERPLNIVAAPQKSLTAFLGFCRGLCDASKAATTLGRQAAVPPRAAAVPVGVQPQAPAAPASPAAPLPASPASPTTRPAFLPEHAAGLPPEDTYGDLASTIGDVYWDANQMGAMLQVRVRMNALRYQISLGASNGFGHGEDLGSGLVCHIWTSPAFAWYFAMFPTSVLNNMPHLHLKDYNRSVPFPLHQFLHR